MESILIFNYFVIDDEVFGDGSSWKAEAFLEKPHHAPKYCPKYGLSTGARHWEAPIHRLLLHWRFRQSPPCGPLLDQIVEGLLFPFRPQSNFDFASR